MATTTLFPNHKKTSVRADLQNPVEWMQQCLEDARQVENMSCRIDQASRERDSNLAETEAEYTRVINGANAQYETRVREAKAQLEAATSSAIREVRRIDEFIKLTLTPLEILPPYSEMHSINHFPQTDASVETLSAQIREKAATCEKIRQDIKKIADTFKSNSAAALIIGGFSILVLYLMGTAIFNSATGGVAFLIAPLIFLAWLYHTRADLVAKSRDEIRVLAEKLIRLMVTQREQVLASAKKNYEDFEAVALKTVDEQKANAGNIRTNSIQKHQQTFNMKQGVLLNEIKALHEKITQETAACNEDLCRADWSGQAWNGWEPAVAIPSCLRIGTLLPQMPSFRQNAPELTPIAIPALVDYEKGQGILLVGESPGESMKSFAVNAIARLLATVPPASVRFIFIDPVSLGQNVAEFMALDKYDPELIGGKAWSDSRHIDQALTEITDHMETVIQKYLRQDYQSIAEYNATARVKEAYRIPVIFDFPMNFTDSSAKRLVSIMRNGPRCGVFPIVIMDTSKPLPYGFDTNDLAQHAFVIRRTVSQ